MLYSIIGDKNYMKKIKNLFLLLLILVASVTLSGCKKKSLPKNCLVTFNLMGGIYNESSDNLTININEGEQIKLILPSKYGYKFQGWTQHLVQSMVADFDETTKVKENIVLYAVWKKPQLKLHINEGVIPCYDSVDELINDFLRDFNQFNGSTSINEHLFFDYSYNKIVRFLNQYKDKWMGLFDYLATVAHENNREAFQNIFTQGEEVDNNGAKVRAEFSGFLLKRSYESYSTWLVSADYSKVELQEGSFAYVFSKIPTFYVAKTDYYLPKAYRVGYTFLGWYENNDFSGEPVEIIEAGVTKDFELYAKWK